MLSTNSPYSYRFTSVWITFIFMNSRNMSASIKRFVNKKVSVISLCLSVALRFQYRTHFLFSHDIPVKISDKSNIIQLDHYVCLSLKSNEVAFENKEIKNTLNEISFYNSSAYCVIKWNEPIKKLWNKHTPSDEHKTISAQQKIYFPRLIKCPIHSEK